MTQRKNSDFTILVIDDSSTDREIFRLMLQREGYVVEIASSGPVAFDILNQKKIDLILCDYYMPEMTGEEFLSKLRKDPRYRHMCVIIITSDESKEVKIRLLQSGANDFINKGCAYEEIIARVNNFLDSIELSKTKMILEFAGTYAHEMSQPLSSLMASVDLLKAEVDRIGDAKLKEDLNKIVEGMNPLGDRMLEIVGKIRKLEMDKTKHYKR